MAAPVLDFLVLQGELEALLKSELADIRPAVHVLTPAALASEETDSKDKAPGKVHPAPAVNVVYLGHKFSSDAARQRTDGRATLIAQLFALEVVTRNVRSLKAGADARSESGLLAMRVFKAAVGARLPSASSTVRFVPGPGPVYQSGLQYLPLLVQVDLGIVK